MAGPKVVILAKQPVVPPRVQLSHTMGQAVVSAMGLAPKGAMAKAVARAIEAAVFKATPKNTSMSQLHQAVAKVTAPKVGPPVLIPIGSLAAAATTIPSTRLTPAALIAATSQMAVSFPKVGSPLSPSPPLSSSGSPGEPAVTTGSSLGSLGPAVPLFAEVEGFVSSLDSCGSSSTSISRTRAGGGGWWWSQEAES